MSKQKKPSPSAAAAPSGIPAGAIAAAPAVETLAFQADFSCVSCGTCCRTWRIPVDDESRQRLTQALGEGRIAMPAGRSADPERCFEIDGSRTWFARDGVDCVFLEPAPANFCAVHRDAGPGAFTWPCRVYPRLCVIQPAGVRLVLSNYCPTAAALLFRADLTDAAALRIVRNPPAYPLAAGYAGLDARRHAPPLLRPNRPMTWETYAQWERHASGFLGLDEYTPEEALIVLATTAEKARAATPAQAGRPEFFAAIYAAELEADPAALRAQLAGLPGGAARCRVLHQLILEFSEPEKNVFYAPWSAGFSAAYHDQVDPAATARFQSDYERWVRPAWGAFASPLRRWLAARLFASYYAHQGDGLRTAVFAAVGALASLRVHATLACARAGRALDRELFVEAVRASDYLVEHGADKARLARFFSQIEGLPLMELIGPIPA